MQSKLEYEFNACGCVKIERIEVYMFKDSCLSLSFASDHSLVLQDLEGYHILQHLNNND
jgi:hypothetical protein